MTDATSSESVPTSFEYVASEDASQVSLVGSWDDWAAKLPMLKQPNTDTWLVQLTLPPGPVTFKFVTAENWLTTTAYDVVDDGFGGKNNRRIIAVPAANVKADPGNNVTDQSLHDTREHPENDLGHQKDNKQQPAANCVIC